MLLAAAARGACRAAAHRAPLRPAGRRDGGAQRTCTTQPVAHVEPRRIELDPQMAARHPLRILLAEDHVVNQKLALRLLQQMGYEADLARDGLSASREMMAQALRGVQARADA